MPTDKFTAVWTSHSSIGDYLKCPRAYFLKNVYKDPRTGHKITLAKPALSLGQAVHSVIESLSTLPVEKRLEESLIDKFENAFRKVAGKLGGFRNKNEEDDYKQRGREMLKKVMDNPGPILNKAVKINQDLPYFWLSEEENIILCGLIDWLEYIPENNSVHIIDFKTGNSRESSDSLQLPIYYLLAINCQKRPVSRASYWYIGKNPSPNEISLPDKTEAYDKILQIAKKIKLARTLNHFRCPANGCRECEPFEQIVENKAEMVGVDNYNRDIYIL